MSGISSAQEKMKRFWKLTEITQQDIVAGILKVTDAKRFNPETMLNFSFLYKAAGLILEEKKKDTALSDSDREMLALASHNLAASKDIFANWSKTISGYSAPARIKEEICRKYMIRTLRGMTLANPSCDPDTAMELFKKFLNLEDLPQTKIWEHVLLQTITARKQDEPT